MKQKIFFLIVIVIIGYANLYGQGNSELPYSTIHILRTNSVVGSACRSIISLPNQREFTLNPGTLANYKVYSDGEIEITAETFCGQGRGTSGQVILNVVRGKEYFVVYNLGRFNEVEESKFKKEFMKCHTVIKKEENIESPINKASLEDIEKKESKGQGTCFLISSDGYFITNFHCVENSKELTIKGIDGDFTTKYGAVVVASDPSNDLALLKVNNKNLKLNNPPFAIRSTGIAQAEKVYAIGFPHADAMGEEVKITEGIISSKSGAQGDVSKFQISAAVNPGNSGGPLIDEKGNVIGVIYAKSTIAEAAGYAIKSSYLETFLKNIDGFEYPKFMNTISDKALTDKIAEFKKYIFIVETN